MNLKDRQVELLRAIVSGHELYGGEEFIFVDADVDPQLTYTSNRWIPVRCTRLDFVQLERSGYIIFVPSGRRTFRGQPTHLGVLTVGNDFAPDNEASKSARTTVPGKIASPEIGSSQFWKDRQAEFLAHTVRFPGLSFLWRGVFRQWRLWWGSSPKDYQKPPAEAESLFMAIVRKANLGLPEPKKDTDPSYMWLDHLRENGRSFIVTGREACTEREWDGGVKDGEALIQVRKRQKYTTGDEWTKVYRRGKSGKLRRLSARALESTSREMLHTYYHWIESGRINNVFQASADMCEELASRAFASAIKRNASVAPSIEVPSEQPPAIRKSTADSQLDCAPEEEGRRTPDPNPIAEQRAALLIAFKARGRTQGIRVTDEMVAKAANPGKWNDRTMVTWWKRNDPGCKLLHDKNIRAVLTKEPSSIWGANIKIKRPAK